MNIKTNNRPRLKSRLTPGLKRLLVAALGLAVFMLANTAYLLLNRLADNSGFEYFAIGETSLPKLFQAMVLTHTGAGTYANNNSCAVSATGRGEYFIRLTVARD